MYKIKMVGEGGGGYRMYRVEVVRVSGTGFKIGGWESLSMVEVYSLWALDLLFFNFFKGKKKFLLFYYYYISSFFLGGGGGMSRAEFKKWPCRLYAVGFQNPSKRALKRDI